MTNRLTAQEKCKCMCSYEHPNGSYKCRITNDGFGWGVEGIDGWGHRYEASLPQIKYCPWCGGMLPKEDTNA